MISTLARAQKQGILRNVKSPTLTDAVAGLHLRRRNPRLPSVPSRVFVCLDCRTGRVKQALHAPEANRQQRPYFCGHWLDSASR